MASAKRYHKEKMARRKEEKQDEPELPKYRDRAKERREDQNPDYEPTELGSFHAVAPPGTVDLRIADAHKISIENSKYLGGDLEHTHLVKGLDYALLHKVRSEIDKKPEQEEEVDGKTRSSVYEWIVKPQTVVKTNEMFLPGRMAFVFDMEEDYAHDIPTTVHRSKADCPVPQEMVTVSVDGSVLDRIAKIMSYLRLGSSGKVLKKKKKDRSEVKGKISAVGHEDDEDEKALRPADGIAKHQVYKEMGVPQPSNGNHRDEKNKQGNPVNRAGADDIFVGDGTDYTVGAKDLSQSPISEDMEESPRNRERPSYFSDPVYGPAPPTELVPDWQQTNGYDTVHGPVMPTTYQGEWQDYQYAEQMAYPDQYIQHNVNDYEPEAGVTVPLDPRFMTQEDKDRGLGSVFKRDDQRLQQLREKDAREKDPNFISESYSECYPGYQEYNREVVFSDDEDDLSKMDMGGRAKGRLHRWDFETEEEWATYNEQKEAMPKAAFQFGVKMQDGRKTRKQNKDQKLTNELHKINKILARKKAEKGETFDDGGQYDDDAQPGKKLRI
ncbi:hypothetical protein AMTRI_Chr12g234400 [Amborella trichopoda]